jgi:hypothetical protein
MRWSYKNVHYDYKKEGLLGGTFLDEAEIEQSMNEFGHAGWELVSLFDVHDGLVAIFKQPLDLPVSQSARSTNEAFRNEHPVTVERISQPERVAMSSQGEELEKTVVLREGQVPPQDITGTVPQTFRPAQMKVDNKRLADEEDTNNGVGSIRIE